MNHGKVPPPKINMSPEQGSFLKERLVFQYHQFFRGNVGFPGKAMPLKGSLFFFLPERRSPSIKRKDSLSEEQREKDRLAVTWRCEDIFSAASAAARQVLRLMPVIAFPAPALPWTQGFCMLLYLQYVKQLDRTWLCCICICLYELAYTYAFGLAMSFFSSSQNELMVYSNTMCIAHRPAQGRTCLWINQRGPPRQRGPPALWSGLPWKPIGFP